MEKIILPEPVMSGGKPLMDVIHERHSSGNFDTKPLNKGQLSNLLWAVFGVNRPESGKRTAPSACNIREMKLYVIMADGAFVYDPLHSCLDPIISGDLRAKSSIQPE